MSTPINRGKSSKIIALSFSEFQSHVSDVWDIDDVTDTQATSAFSTEKKSAPTLNVASNSRGSLSTSATSKSSTTATTKGTSSNKINSSSKNIENHSSSQPQCCQSSSSSSSLTTTTTTTENADDTIVNNGVINVPVISERRTAPGLGIRLMDCHYTSINDNLSGSGKCGKKLEKFKEIIFHSVSNLGQLKTLSWSGVPVEVRYVVWKLLVGYLPPCLERREQMLNQKRRQYFEYVDMYYNAGSVQRVHNEMCAQIQKDLHRMSALQNKVHIQKRFERMLAIWSLRHPASGYVQGINDLVMPFFVVFLSEFVYVDMNTSLELTFAVEPSDDQLDWVEADCYWCLSVLLDGIQDRYTFAQPGIQRAVGDLASLIQRYDACLHKHLVLHKVAYLQFAFRWMNNLLMRELPLRCVIRLWDTYQCEDQGYSKFHVYVCAALLLHFKKDILKKDDFQSIMILLQNLPTCHWTDEEVSEVLAQAYSLQCYFSQARNHLSRAAPDHVI